MKNNPKIRTESALFVASRNKEAKVLKLLNPKRAPLTPDVLKSFPPYQHLSLEEAEAMCASFRTLARLLLEYIAAVENTNTIDNQHVISLGSNQNPKIVALNPKKLKPKAA